MAQKQVIQCDICKKITEESAGVVIGEKNYDFCPKCLKRLKKFLKLEESEEKLKGDLN